MASRHPVRNAVCLAVALAITGALSACSDTVTQPISPGRTTAHGVSHDDVTGGECLSGWVLVGGKEVCLDP